jgi:hypothetical protein
MSQRAVRFAADAECQRVGTRPRIADTDELVPLAEKLLEVPQQLIRTALELELKDGTVIADRVGETPCVSLAGLYRAERTIAESIPKISKVANAERFEAW